MQLTLALACAAHRPAGYGSVDARSSLYTDTDATTISTSAVAVRAVATEQISLSARHLVDFTSTASVDVVSAATGRWTELRHETAGGIAWADGTQSAGADYVYSQENDWWSHTVAARGTRDLLQHNLTVGLGGSYVTNRIGRRDDEAFTEAAEGLSGTASLVIVGSPDDLWKLVYTVARTVGYQASPYRLVRFEDSGLPSEVLLGQPETLPDLRNRHALTARYNRWLWATSALRSHVRGYVDDWGVASLTGGTEWVVALGPVELGLDARGYLQRHATFYADQYPERLRYMTSDRELSSFWDLFVGARAGVTSEMDGALRGLRAEVRLTGFTFRFRDFTELPRRDGLIAELGLGASF